MRKIGERDAFVAVIVSRRYRMRQSDSGKWVGIRSGGHGYNGCGSIFGRTVILADPYLLRWVPPPPFVLTTAGRPSHRGGSISPPPATGGSGGRPGGGPFCPQIETHPSQKWLLTTARVPDIVDFENVFRLIISFINTNHEAFFEIEREGSCQNSLFLASCFSWR